MIIGGSGGVGSIAVQIARRKGAKVTAICSKEFVKNLDADKVISYDSKNDMIDELKDAANAFGKFNVIFDTVTSNEKRDEVFACEKNICETPELLTAGYRYVKIGGYVSQWVLAHLKRFLGINLFPKNKELFWIRTIVQKY